MISVPCSNQMKTIQELTDENRHNRSAVLEEDLVRLRIAAGQQLRDRAPAPPAVLPEYEDVFPGVAGLPEIGRGELHAGTLAAGILHHGALLVRGLYDRAQLRSLSEAAALDQQRGESHSGALGCSPHTLFELLEIYRESGLLDAVRDYLDGEPLLFGERVKLRRQERQRDKYAAIPWHQDAAFFGCLSRAVNCWAAVTPCGEENPGLSIIPRRAAELYGWNLADGHAPLDYGRSIDPAAFEQLLVRCSPVDCVLEPGDAVLFDEMTVHQTLSRPWKRDEQLVTISWFFRPSGFPLWGTPLAV